MTGNKLTLAVFLDALGWRIAEQHSFLHNELPYRTPLATTFGYSSTCDPTILTGALPQEHGHFAFFRYSPDESPFQKILWPRRIPKSVARRGRVRRWVSKVVRLQMGYQGYFQLYNMPFGLLSEVDYTEKRDIYQKGGINGGQTTLFDDLRAKQIPFHLSDWRQSEESNLARAKAALQTGEPRFAYLFLAHLDSVLHAVGTRSEGVKQKLRWYEKELQSLIALAHKHYEDVQLVLFSDHGMTDIHSECRLMETIEQLPLQQATDYFAIYDSTMARFWFLNDHAAKVIDKALTDHPQGRWLSAETLAEWGCDFHDQRYGQSFFLLHPGVLLNPSHMGEYRLAGMHGYEPDHIDSTAFFGTSDPTLVAPKGLHEIRKVLSESAGIA